MKVEGVPPPYAGAVGAGGVAIVSHGEIAEDIVSPLSAKADAVRDVAR